jgi:hypothetical protein
MDEVPIDCDDAECKRLGEEWARWEKENRVDPCGVCVRLGIEGAPA